MNTSGLVTKRKQAFVASGESYDLVRKNRADDDDLIMFKKPAIDVDWHVHGKQAATQLIYLSGRNGADGLARHALLGLFGGENGAYAPETLSNMLSRPAMGMTRISVTVGAPEAPAWRVCLLMGIASFGRGWTKRAAYAAVSGCRSGHGASCTRDLADHKQVAEDGVLRVSTYVAGLIFRARTRG